jgi:hypothetical protein
MSGRFDPANTNMIPHTHPLKYVPRVNTPILMLNGEYDTITPLDTGNRPMFEMPGTDRRDKELKVYKTDHIAPRNEFIKEIFA